MIEKIKLFLSLHHKKGDFFLGKEPYLSYHPYLTLIYKKNRSYRFRIKNKINFRIDIFKGKFFVKWMKK